MKYSSFYPKIENKPENEESKILSLPSNETLEK